MSRSSNASHYGARFEAWLARDRQLRSDGTHTSWCDLEFQNGTPVEAKATMAGTGYFQIYEEYHDRLERADGWYGFGVYRPRGNGTDGIRVLKAKMRRARDLDLRGRWSPTGGHRDSRKAKLPVTSVFG